MNREEDREDRTEKRTEKRTCEERGENRSSTKIIANIGIGHDGTQEFKMLLTQRFQVCKKNIVELLFSRKLQNKSKMHMYAKMLHVFLPLLDL